MKLNNYNNLKAVVRELAHQLAPLLHKAQRLQRAVEARGITGLELLRSRIVVPEGCTLGEDGKVYDAENNVVADYSAELYECNSLLSALTGLRAAVAVLAHDTEFIQRGITDTEWWYFVEMFMDDDMYGWLK